MVADLAERGAVMKRKAVTVHGEASALVRCSPGDFLDFVMEPVAYAAIDDKIGAIRWVDRDGEVVTFRFRARLFRMPGPLVTHRMTRTGNSRVDIEPVPSWQERFGHFRASFACVPSRDGAVVTRRLEFTLPWPLSQLAWMLDRWLKREVPDELAAAIRSSASRKQ